MLTRPILLSLTRISDLAQHPFEICPLDRSHWETGDYVAANITSRLFGPRFELVDGRMMEANQGETIVGALGVRAATLDTVGDWQSVGPDGRMQALTGAGLLGRATSRSPFGTGPVDLDYSGHVVRNGVKVRMRDFVPMLSEPPFACPTVLLIGTSMSSGKTTSAKVIIRHLKGAGLKVVGVKLTGAGRYRDVLSMRDSGADAIFDFVDVGLPSTVCSADEYLPALATLLHQVAAVKPDVVVAEAGASPLEPYNGAIAMQQIGAHVRLSVLCASDPYAVVGVTKGFGFQADLVAGVATSTTAGVAVITRLTGAKALDLTDPESHAELSRILRDKFGP